MLRTCTALTDKLRCKCAHLGSSSACLAQGLPADTADCCAAGPGRHCCAAIPKTDTWAVPGMVSQGCRSAIGCRLERPFLGTAICTG